MKSIDEIIDAIRHAGVVFDLETSTATQAWLVAGNRRARAVGTKTKGLWVVEMLVDGIVCGRCMTANWHIAVQVCALWLAGRALAEMRSVPEFAPSERGTAWEEGRLREYEWAALEKRAPHEVRVVVRLTASYPELRELYPVLRLVRLTFSVAFGQESAGYPSIRPTADGGYEVLDEKSNRILLGSAEDAVKTVAELVRQVKRNA